MLTLTLTSCTELSTFLLGYHLAAEEKKIINTMHSFVFISVSNTFVIHAVHGSLNWGGFIIRVSCLAMLACGKKNGIAKKQKNKVVVLFFHCFQLFHNSLIHGSSKC